MFKRAMRTLRRHPPGAGLHWLNANIAIGRVQRTDAWSELHVAGVRAVVDISEETEGQGDAVREQGMRYLRFCLHGSPLPSAEDLRIISAWVQDRIAEDGPVFVQDGSARFNDGLVAVASLIRGGLPAHLALLALRRAVPDGALNREQQGELVRFTAALETEAVGEPHVAPLGKGDYAG